MGFGQRVINFQGLQRGLLGPWKGLLWGNETEGHKAVVGIGQTGISQSVIRVFLNRLLKVLDALVQSFLASLVPPETAFQIVLIGFGTGGVALGHALLIFT